MVVIDVVCNDVSDRFQLAENFRERLFHWHWELQRRHLMASQRDLSNVDQLDPEASSRPARCSLS